MRRLVILPLVILSFALVSCGGDNGSCVDACRELKATLEYQLPDLKVCCDDLEWHSAGSCRECLEVLFDMAAVSPVDEAEFCHQFYSSGG